MKQILGHHKDTPGQTDKRKPPSVIFSQIDGLLASLDLHILEWPARVDDFSILFVLD